MGMKVLDMKRTKGSVLVLFDVREADDSDKEFLNTLKVHQVEQTPFVLGDSPNIVLEPASMSHETESGSSDADTTEKENDLHSDFADDGKK